MTFPIPEFAPVTSTVFLSAVFSKPGLLSNLRHVFDFAALQSSKRRVQNFLILPALFTPNRKRRLALNCIGELIHLPRISQLVGNLLGLDDLSRSPQLQRDRMVHRQPVVRSQAAFIAHKLNRGAIISTHRDHHAAQGSALELQRKYSCRLDPARLLVPHAPRSQANDSILQDVLQCIDAMHAHIADGPAARQRRISQPLARMRLAKVRELGSRENRPSDLSSRDPLSKTRHAIFETKNMCDTQ